MRPVVARRGAEASKEKRFSLRVVRESGIFNKKKKGKAMEETKGNFLLKLAKNNFIMKLINSRISQFISAGVGFLVGQILSSGFLEKVQGNEALTQFLTDVGIAPTEAGITGLLTGLFWAVYNLGMTLMYGAKFKEIQQAHGLVTDRWAGDKTMTAAKGTK